MKTSQLLKRAGISLLLCVVFVMVPYTLLTILFNYPDILRSPAGKILISFHQGGPTLILTWFFFALGGLPLIYAYHQIYSLLGPNYRIITTTGLFGLFVQLIGLLRWVFVVPILANNYVQTTDPILKTTIEQLFIVQHQWGGVLLGEHLGQLTTIIWTIVIFQALSNVKLINQYLKWIAQLGSMVYFLGQAELLHTVMPNLPYWEDAAFIGSTVWLVCLIWLGVVLLQKASQSALALVNQDGIISATYA